MSVLDVEVTSDRGRMDVDRVHAWLTNAYWSVGVPREVVERAMERSLFFAAFLGAVQIGFARVVTDATTFAYVCDVIVDEAHRGKGVGKALMTAVMAHADMQGLRRIGLVTLDAHRLYEPFGFSAIDRPERHMAIVRADPYRERPGA